MTARTLAAVAGLALSLVSGCSVRVVTEVRTGRDGRLVVRTCDLYGGFVNRLSDCEDNHVEGGAK